MIQAEGKCMIRLAHLSDIHLFCPKARWRRSDWFNKRFTGWLNLRLLGRAARFRHAALVLRALADDIYERRADCILFTGDATALGFEQELAEAAKIMRVGSSGGLPGLAVPGNHDYYTRAVEAAGRFEHYFAPWQIGVRVDEAVYPFAQRVGPVWLVGVNTARGSFWTWDASGAVEAAQLDRLGRLLERLEPGPRILVTHYPLCTASGRRERRSHGLRNAADLVAVAARGGVSLWLHGHRHSSYCLTRPPQAPFPVICAGSATQEGRWSYGEYTITGRQLQATRRIFTAAGGFDEGESFTLELP